MAKLIKSSFYIISILNIILIGVFFIFSVNAIVINYKKIIEINKEAEDIYYNTINQYKKLLIFLLKNKLPTNILYINFAAAAVYNIPLVKSLNVFDSKDSKLSESGNPIANSAIETVIECYSGRCLNITVEKKELLTRLLSGKELCFFELKHIQASKLFAIKLSISRLIKKYPLYGLMLLYFAIFYFFQSLWLFFNNRKLKKVNYHIRGKFKKKNIELKNQIINNDKIYRSITITSELLDEYFTYYTHEMLTKNIFVEEVSLREIFQQIKDYCGVKLVKHGLKLTLDLNNKDDVNVKSDRRMLFIILLNHVYRAIVRAKTDSEIRVIASQDKSAVYINIEDMGYEYIPRINKKNNKVYLCELSKPILDEFCFKLGAKISEERNNNNKISITIIKEHKDGNSKVINFKPYVLHN